MGEGAQAGLGTPVPVPECRCVHLCGGRMLMQQVEAVLYLCLIPECRCDHQRTMREGGGACGLRNSPTCARGTIISCCLDTSEQFK